MNGSLQRLDAVARSLLPAALTVLLGLVVLVPLGEWGLAPVLPALTIIAVYYWAVHRPDLMPVWAAFLLGLFQDLVSGQPIGLGALSLVIVHGIVSTQRRVFLSATFGVMWSIFAAIAFVTTVLDWVLICLINLQLVDPEPGLFRYLATVAAYPCLAWVFARAQRAVLRRV